MNNFFIYHDDFSHSLRIILLFIMSNYLFYNAESIFCNVEYLFRSGEYTFSSVE